MKRIYDYKLTEKVFRAFMETLNNPPAPNAALKALMQRKAPWEQDTSKEDTP